MNIDSLPSELFSRILFFLDGPDRLTLRLCSRAMEEAVAQSDLHASPDSYKQRDISLRTIFPFLYASRLPKDIIIFWHLPSFPEEWLSFMSRFYGSWRIEFGDGLKPSLPYGDWESALHIRKRFFNRGYANRLCINSMNYNEVPISVLLQLIEGLVYEQVHISAVNEEFGENFIELIRHFRDKLLNIYIYGRVLDRETLLSLKAGTELQVVETNRFDGTHREESDIIPEPEWKVDDDLLLVLVRKEFRMLRIPVDLRDEATIVEVIKMISASSSPQAALIKIPEARMDRFLNVIRMRREDRMFIRNIGCEFQLKLAERIPFTHTLIYQNTTAKAHYRMEERKTVISLMIENSLYSAINQS